MFNKYIKLVIAVIIAVFAVLQFIDENIGTGFFTNEKARYGWNC